uniref:hypothetical protein n=1 Tax=Sphingomonas bacterium TaxID=1895847 RepID=UPI002626C9BE|nr:hypothetical protein [Sphingomonas bacterium]
MNATVSDTRPNGIRGLAAGSVAAEHQQLTNELAPEKGAVLALRNKAMARQLLARAPLDPAAQTYLGLAADGSKDRPRALKLMTLALRSEERSLRPRLWLMDEDLRRRNYAGAIEHFDRLASIGPAASEAAIAAMTPIVRDPASHAPLARKLATNPLWRSSFLYALNRQGVSPDVVFRLTPQGSAKAQVLSEQGALLLTLVKNHEYERAYLAWINFLPPASLGHVGPVFDPQFQNFVGPMPFNWQLTDTTDGSSEFRKPSGLVVSYLGTAAANLTEQTLLLPAGRYRLSTVATGADENNQLSWTVSCSSGSEPLQTLRLAKLQAGRQRYNTMFSVPSPGCESQRLALVGSPSEFPRTADAVIEEIRIEPVK